MPNGASLGTPIHFVSKEEGLVALKLRDAAITYQGSPTTSKTKTGPIGRVRLGKVCQYVDGNGSGLLQ